MAKRILVVDDEKNQREILETIRMTEMEHLDIRTVTMGINLSDCASRSSRAVIHRCSTARTAHSEPPTAITGLIR